MLSKFALFWLFFALFALVLLLVPNTLLAAFICAVFGAGAVFVLIKFDAKKLNDRLENLQNFSPNYESKRPFFDEILALCAKFDEIESQLKEKNRKSIKKSAKIKLRNNQLQGILSSISHEFKNPVAIIEAAVKTIKNDENLEREMLIKFIEKITRNSQRLVNLIDRLNLRSTESLSLNLSKFELRNVTMSVRNELLEKYKGRQIVISSGGAIIDADEELIKQVLTNLVENALKYSQDVVEIGFTKGAILVKDRGVGIDQKEIKLITKKYFKTKDNVGTNSFGLGLYIAKQILKMHGFELIISSQLGQGSTFGFRFEAERADEISA